MKTVEDVEAKFRSLAAEYGYELVELTGLRLGGRTVIRAYIHRPGGVRIKDCEVLSRAYSDYLDIEDPIEGKYTLEVSSLGLDRPLLSPDDFRRRVGETIILELKPGTVQGMVEGKLLSGDSAGIIIMLDAGERRFDFDQIIRGKIVY